jgi:hypothetical protein
VKPSPITCQLDLRLAAEEGFLAGVGAALHELHHAYLHAVADGPGEHAEGGAGLAVAGVHQQAAGVGGSGDGGVDDGLLAFHAGLVAGVAVGGVGQGVLSFLVGVLGAVSGGHEQRRVAILHRPQRVAEGGGQARR